MYQISNEKFGVFITELRKEKGLTQKQLAERLFVSDKTVSKWERGLSMPNVALLLPIAEALGVTVTELLRGEKLDSDRNLNNKEVETLVVNSLDLTITNAVKHRKRIWSLVYFASLFIAITEIGLLYKSGLSFMAMKDNVILIAVLMLVFGGWFCFFAKDLLPGYYDKNKINYYSQGFFRLHMPGLSFNNGNWSYICNAMKAATLSIAVLYPLSALLIINMGSIELWGKLQNVLLFIALAGMFVPMYIVGRKYE